MEAELVEGSLDQPSSECEAAVKPVGSMPVPTMPVQMPVVTIQSVALSSYPITVSIGAREVELRLKNSIGL